MSTPVHMTLNNTLFELCLDLAKYPGGSEEDALNRRVVLRKALVRWGDQRYQDGYVDRMLDLSDARIEAQQRADEVTAAKPPAGTVLHQERDVLCQYDVQTPEGDTTPCGETSSFVVERNDGDRSFGYDGQHESCWNHLDKVVEGMVGGDERVRAIVTIRWSAGESQ